MTPNIIWTTRDAYGAEFAHSRRRITDFYKNSGQQSDRKKTSILTLKKTRGRIKPEARQLTQVLRVLPFTGLKYSLIVMKVPLNPSRQSMVTMQEHTEMKTIGYNTQAYSL